MNNKQTEEDDLVDGLKDLTHDIHHQRGAKLKTELTHLDSLTADTHDDIDDDSDDDDSGDDEGEITSLTA